MKRSTLKMKVAFFSIVIGLLFHGLCFAHSDHEQAVLNTEDSGLDLEGLKRFHGHLGPYLILGARAVELATESLMIHSSQLNVVLSVNLNSPERCMADAVQFTSDATYGRGRIAVLRSAVPMIHAIDQRTGNTVILQYTETTRELLSRLPKYTGVGTDSDRIIEELAGEAATLKAKDLWSVRLLKAE